MIVIVNFFQVFRFSRSRQCMDSEDSEGSLQKDMLKQSEFFNVFNFIIKITNTRRFF